jgi:hypothetical protein
MLKRARVWVVAVVAALLATSNVCHAQDVVLYEISEAVKVNGKTASFNSSEAVLMGWARAGTPVCPLDLGLSVCAVTVRAIGKASDDTGIGPVDGKFSVMVQYFNPFDAAELAVITGKISGDLDLSPIFLRKTPLGTVTGTYDLKGVKDTVLNHYNQKGRFTGTFRLPFDHNGVVSYMMDDGSIVPVQQPQETSLNVPTVRLELRLQ